MHSKSDSMMMMMMMMMNDEVDEIIEELFDLLKIRYQNNLE